MSRTDAAVAEIRSRLAAGNALSANDSAASALEGGCDTPEIRYLYLLSLAASGATQRALARYDELAPPPEARDEDWLALPARLRKDLAFAQIEPERNLMLAAQLYADAHRRTGGSFTGINAATLHMLAGEHVAAERLASAVLATMTGAPPAGDRAAYYWHATRAEALLLLARMDDAAAALRAADPLIRDDLTTRSRTRRQIGRILRERGRSELRLEQLIALPFVYLFDPEAVVDGIPAIDAALARQIDGSPVFMAVPRSAGGLRAAHEILRCGGRVHVALANADPGAEARAFLDRAERQSVVAGFLADETTWRDAQVSRLAHGLARVSAATLATGLRSLAVRDGERWAIVDEPDSRLVPSQKDRLTVGLVFADVVGYSRFSDAEIRDYWTRIVPRYSAVLDEWKPSVLRRQTWGDALHIVTADPQSAAWLALRLLEVTREARAGQSGHLAELELRIGAHFAPAFRGHDRVEDRPTFFGTQLSFTARVEPVTPPGTVYVTEAFLSELELQRPGLFRSEYAGEVPLAKQYGVFRLSSLKNQAPLFAMTGAPAATGPAPPRPLVVGVTGHLKLDADARKHVTAAVRQHLRARLRGAAKVHLLCGLAPGADLVLAEAVDDAARDLGAALHLDALLVAEPAQMIDQWLARAAELGDSPSQQAQGTVATLMGHWLRRANSQQELWKQVAPPELAFQRLGAVLACRPDLLIAVLRPGYDGKPGGTGEVVSWWRDPARIPRELRESQPPVADRELLLIDPDSGTFTVEKAAGIGVRVDFGYQNRL